MPISSVTPGEGHDPIWRNHDSRWLQGEFYWFGTRYHWPRFWQSLRMLFGAIRKEEKYPDEIVADEVCEALAHEPEVDANEIEVSVRAGHVTLRGRATDHWMKQQAEDAVYFIPGVRGVSNEIEVRAA